MTHDDCEPEAVTECPLCAGPLAYEPAYTETYDDTPYQGVPLKVPASLHCDECGLFMSLDGREEWRNDRGAVVDPRGGLAMIEALGDDGLDLIRARMNAQLK